MSEAELNFLMFKRLFMVIASKITSAPNNYAVYKHEFVCKGYHSNSHQKTYVWKIELCLNKILL